MGFHRINDNNLPLADSKLLQFITSPYPFYQNNEGVSEDTLEWRNRVQMVVNDVVHEFYQYSPNKRTASMLLELLSNYWQLLELDFSKLDVSRNILIVKLTDHLLRYLISEGNKSQRHIYAMRHAQWDISFVIDTDEASINVRKFLLDPSHETVELFHYMMLVCSKKFLRLSPTKIEIVSLLEGKTYSFSPAAEDLLEGYRYARAFQNVACAANHCMKNDHYNETCLSCPFKKQISDELRRV